MYDQHSARLLRSTDWRRHGALRNPPASVRQWGKSLNEAAALGQARLAAASQGSGAASFWQHHPVDQRAFILCQANASTGPGWSIDLLGEDQRPTGWALKGDRVAELHCDCHCEWNPGCPGVVSVPAGSRPPSPMPSPAPSPAAAWGDRWPAPVAVAATAAPEPQQAVSVPDGWRWPSSVPAASYAGEADRGELHAAHEYEQNHEYHHSPALPAPHPDPEPVPLRRRGIFRALFGRREESQPPTVAAPQQWAEIEHQFGYENQPEAWRWPSAALPGAAWESPLAVEHHAASWPALELPALDAPIIGWDAPAPAWSDPDPSYAAPPAPETETLSTQAEIDSFIEVAWETAEPAADVPALPPPDVGER